MFSWHSDFGERTILKLGKVAFGAWYRLRLRSGENFDAATEVIHPN